MDNKSYSVWRDEFLAQQLPYRTVEPQELISTGENSYILNGLELAVKPDICAQIDAYMGVTSQQSKSVTDTFGSGSKEGNRKGYASEARGNPRRRVLRFPGDVYERQWLFATTVLCVTEQAG